MDENTKLNDLLVLAHEARQANNHYAVAMFAHAMNEASKVRDDAAVKHAYAGFNESWEIVERLINQKADRSISNDA